MLDLFSAAAGGWSLGFHRAGFKTAAACEWIDWRRALYAQNNPGVKIYDDVRTLTADRIVSDLGYFPRVVVGSPPCQDISPANTKGKGVEGERSGLFFEAVRLIGEGRPRWFALENSANLRTRGADAVLAALEALGYSCWAFVVRAGDIGANHERGRSWLIGCDLEQVADPDGFGRYAGWQGRRFGVDLSAPYDLGDASGIGHEGGRPRRHGADGDSSASIGPGHVCEHGIRWPWACDECDDAAYAESLRQFPRPGLPGEVERHEPEDTAGDASQDGWGEGRQGRCSEPASGLSVEARRHAARNAPYADQAGQADGCLESSVRPAEEPDNGRRDVASDDVAYADGEGKPDGALNAEMGWGPGIGGDASEPWADWNGGLAHHLRVDDGLSAWVAGSRIAVGGPRGTSAASLIVEAFGDAVVPQIPEAIGRAILRVEAAMAAVAA